MRVSRTEGVAIEIFPILGEAATTVEPCQWCVRRTNAWVTARILWRGQITARCCARAASGQAAAPLRRVMNSRRLRGRPPARLQPTILSNRGLLCVTAKTGRPCPSWVDIVAKRFCPSGRERLIQGEARMRNIDSNTLPRRFDCCRFLFHRTFAATFATISVKTGKAPIEH
jgi:hypothetical protein